jgi:hypothetical protein
MSAVILQFPRHLHHGGDERVHHHPHRGAHRPFNRVHVLPGDLDWNEWWAIAGSFGWLHGSRAAAIDDAVGLACDYGLPVSIDQ